MYLCKACPKAFKTKNSLRQHEEIHAKVLKEIFYCEVCKSIFETSTELKNHMNIHKGFSCNFCNAEFQKSDYLNNHLTKCKEKPIPCDICTVEFKRKALKTHIKTHEMKCNECGKKFVNKGNLMRHMQIHNETEQGICDVCNKIYPSKETLETHIRYMHGDAKDKFCGFCSKLEEEDLRKKVSTFTRCSIPWRKGSKISKIEPEDSGAC